MVEASPKLGKYSVDKVGHSLLDFYQRLCSSPDIPKLPSTRKVRLRGYLLIGLVILLSIGLPLLLVVINS